jgi:hypothetical protein
MTDNEKIEAQVDDSPTAVTLKEVGVSGGKVWEPIKPKAVTSPTKKNEYAPRVFFFLVVLPVAALALNQLPAVASMLGLM